MPRTADTSLPGPTLSAAASAGAALDVATDTTNRGGTTTTISAQPVPLGTVRGRAAAGMLLQTRPESLSHSQTVLSGYTGVVFGTLTIPDGVLLTVDGFLAVTGIVYTS